MDACGPWKHWSEGLLKDLNDSKQWILSNKNVVVIRDQFPKAKFHYLVLPRENISSIFDLTKDHVHLLDEMYLMALDVIRINGHQQKDFQIGFHAQPSMRHLHMHVISTDFDSPTLKTKRHWNSFHTELFIPYQDLIRRINEEGEVLPLDERIVDELRRTPLKCHRCTAIPRTVLAMKLHLRIHHSA